VIRGRVVTKLGMGLMGVRVSTTVSREGFTITRDDGWFDLVSRKLSLELKNCIKAFKNLIEYLWTLRRDLGSLKTFLRL
jgi:hypothetical protein